MRQQGNAPHKEKTVNYIDGNTVRKLQPNPNRRSEETHRELVEKQKREREQRERKEHFAEPYSWFGKTDGR